MKILVASANLVAFLTAVYHAYYSHKDAEKIVSEAAPRDFLNEYIEVTEDRALAKRVRGGIIKKGGTDFYKNVALAYHSGDPEKESVIFEYLRFFFSDGKNVAERFYDSRVEAFYGLLRKVTKEIDRLQGFIRLQEMKNGVYYGWYSSDNDILEYLAPEFSKSFNTQRFVLHDYKRRKMAFFDGTRIEYGEAPSKVVVELSDRESEFQALWKQYHKNVSISDRENLKLQRAFLPKKYRHFMNEF